MKQDNHIQEDPRYVICTREMFTVLGFFIVNLLIVIGLSMGIGLNKPADEVKLIMGFPDWFFWSSFIGSIILIILTYLMVKFLFTEVSLEDEE